MNNAKPTYRNHSGLILGVKFLKMSDEAVLNTPWFVVDACLQHTHMLFACSVPALAGSFPSL